MQVGGIALQRDILVEENKSESTDNGKEDFNFRLLEEIADRREMSRAEDADIAKKPLLSYNEWRDIDEGLYREERVRDMIVEGETSGGGVPSWVYWNRKDTTGQWNWLGGLGFYPRRRPVRECAEELVGAKNGRSR